MSGGGRSSVPLDGLFTAITNVNFDADAIQSRIAQIHEGKIRSLVFRYKNCQSPCGYSDDYDMKNLWNAQEDIRSLKSLILFGIRGMAAYAYHAKVLGYTDKELNRFFHKALFAIGEDWDMERLLSIVLEVGKYNLTCMELLQIGRYRNVRRSSAYYSVTDCGKRAVL